MVSWSHGKQLDSVKAILRGVRSILPDEEAGQSCPRCGDLWPWSYTRCRSCGARLV